MASTVQFSLLEDLPTLVHSSYVGMQDYCPISYYSKPSRSATAGSLTAGSLNFFSSSSAAAAADSSSRCTAAESEDKDAHQSSICCVVSIRDLIFQDFKEASIESLLKLPRNTKLLFSVRDLRSVMCDANNESVLFDGAGGRYCIFFDLHYIHYYIHYHYSSFTMHYSLCTIQEASRC